MHFWKRHVRTGRFCLKRLRSDRPRASAWIEMACLSRESCSSLARRRASSNAARRSSSRCLCISSCSGSGGGSGAPVSHTRPPSPESWRCERKIVSNTVDLRSRSAPICAAAEGRKSFHSSGAMPSTFKPSGAISERVARSCSRNGFLWLLAPALLARRGRPWAAPSSAESSPAEEPMP
eukprot:scaffold42167_cov30-Tisochrysis_lutea.AAC.3